MNLKYNGLERTEPIITFSDVYNIVQVQQSITGEKGQLELTTYNDWQQIVTGNSQYYFTLFGETITNVMSPQDAKNKRFYISNDPIATAASICRALRNCPTIAAGYNVTLDEGDSIVYITAKTIGSKNFANNIDTNIPNANLGILVRGDGSSDDEGDDGGYYNSKIDIDVINELEYITTLEKNFTNNECSFNVSPVLATLTEPSKDNPAILPYSLNVNKLAMNGNYSNLGTISGYTTYGYEANDSSRYMNVGTHILSNNKQTDLSHTLYTYSPKIMFSMTARANGSAGFSITYTVRNSAHQTIYSQTVPYNTPYGDMHIMDIEYNVPDEHFANAYYVDVTYDDEMLRFNVIRPFKTTEYYQRVYWRNEYNGLSFFDFTGKKAESNELESLTFEKNIYDFYDVDVFEVEKIYSQDVEKTVTIKSHLIDENGKYLFNSMIRSKKLWTVIDGKERYIIPTALDITEDETYNGLFTAQLTYKYSV